MVISLLVGIGFFACDGELHAAITGSLHLNGSCVRKKLKNIQIDTARLGLTSPSPWLAEDTVRLAGLLVMGLILRLVFFAGFYGSDEVTYTEASRAIIDGSAAKSTYIGAVRYGINLPVAFFMKAFGISEFSANLWSLLTSIGELGLVYLAGKWMWGTRAATYATLMLALLPVHVHYSGRLMADAPLAFFISAAFVAAWRADKKGTVGAYLLAGFAIGAIFWIKDAVFYLSVMVLGLTLVCGRRWTRRWGWTLVGALSLVAANCALMWVIYGDPFYIYAISAKSLGKLAPVSDTSPSFYLTLLLVNVKHTGVLFYLALAGAVLIFRRHTIRKVADGAEGFVMVWACGFIAVLSLLSLRQVNYMLIFAAPMALLAGCFLSTLRSISARTIIVVVAATGIVLSAFQQQAVQSFTANSKAAITLAENNPDAVIFGSTGAIRADLYQRAVDTRNPVRLPLLPLSSFDRLLGDRMTTEERVALSRAKRAYVVMDPQIVGWGDRTDFGWDKWRSSSCLVGAAPLAPAPLGFGHHIVDGFLGMISLLPSGISGSIDAKLRGLMQPAAATVFQVVSPCFVTGN